jgi:hypothetical protein
MGFCTPGQTAPFLEMAPAFEQAMVDSGIILIKYWLEVSPEEQTRRLESRIDDPRKVWKLSDLDLLSYSWFDYSRARDDMFAATDTAWAQWFVASTDDKEAGPPEHHRPPARPDPLRTTAEGGRHPARAPEGRALPASDHRAPVHPDTVLSGRGGPGARAASLTR